MGKSIVLGLGNCVDYEVVWDSETIERLVAENDILPHELTAEGHVSSPRDLVISLLHFLQTGSGGERFVRSQSILQEIGDRLRKRITVGGTPVRAAIAMSKRGYMPALHLVAMNSHVRKAIPRGCDWVCSAAREELHPHLILQFPEGAQVRSGSISIHAPRANRVIYVHDPVNDKMAISPHLEEMSSDARVFLVSGLNAMRSDALLSERLAELSGVLASLPQDTIVFYEDAGFHDPALSRMVRNALLEYIDIYSLNEDELAGHLERSVAILDPVDALSAVRALQRIIPVPTLVVHTGHWVMASGTGVGRFERPVRAGIVMACTRMRLGDDLGSADVRNTETMTVRPDSAEFASAVNELGGDEILCIPSFAINAGHATTVGLGDTFVGGFLPMLLDERTV